MIELLFGLFVCYEVHRLADYFYNQEKPTYIVVEKDYELKEIND